MASAVVHTQPWWLVLLGSTLPCSSFSVSFSRDQQELYTHTGETGDLLCPPVVPSSPPDLLQEREWDVTHLHSEGETDLRVNLEALGCSELP